RLSWSPVIPASPSQATAPMRAGPPGRAATAVDCGAPPAVTVDRPSNTVTTSTGDPGSSRTTTSAHPAYRLVPVWTCGSAAHQVPPPPACTSAVTSAYAWKTWYACSAPQSVRSAV